MENKLEKNDKEAALLQKVYSKVNPNSISNFNKNSIAEYQHSPMWRWFLESKGSFHNLEEMLNMRSATSIVTRGFGLDRRFSPSYDVLFNKSLYSDIISINESDFGHPEKIFKVINGDKKSGIYLRNACHAYEIINSLMKNKTDKFNILEIGPGFGMLAYLLKKYFKNSTLILVDLPETLAICAWYLENVLHSCSFAYLPADSEKPITDFDIVFINATYFEAGLFNYDLVINIDSFSEMTKEIASNYLSIIEKDISEHGMFFFLNKENMDKNAMARPTAYQFSIHWTFQSIGNTFMGFLNDFRHIQMCMKWSSQPNTSNQLRNKLLDISYQYFFNERLECFIMFQFLENYSGHIDKVSSRLFSLLDNIVHQDTQAIKNGQIILDSYNLSNDSDRLVLTICRILVCDLELDGKLDIGCAKRLAIELANKSKSFYETWASGRILAKLKDHENAKNILKKSLEFAVNLPPSILMKVGEILLDIGYGDLATLAFKCLMKANTNHLAKVELALKLDLSASQIDDLVDRLPDYSFDTGYYIVRVAESYLKAGSYQQMNKYLTPVIDGKIKVGHYDLFIAAQIIEQTGDVSKSDLLINEAITLGHNDNGFYRKIGQYYAKKRNYSSAIKYLKLSLNIDSTWGSTHYDLAKAYEKIGQIELAVKHLNEVLECGFNKEVNDKDVQNRLALLNGNE